MTQNSLVSEVSLQAMEAPSLVMKTGGREICIYIRQGQKSTRLRMHRIIAWQPTYATCIIYRSMDP